MATAQKFLPKIMLALIKGMIRKNIQSDMDNIKSFCEK